MQRGKIHSSNKDQALEESYTRDGAKHNSENGNKNRDTRTKIIKDLSSKSVKKSPSGPPKLFFSHRTSCFILRKTNYVKQQT